MTCNMSSRVPSHSMAMAMRSGAVAGLAALLGLVIMAVPAAAQTLADQPIFSTVNVPGNLALVLSVEYPTAVSVANGGNYADSSTYLGYFDPVKCYNYVYNATTPNQSYFQPAAFATGTNYHSCSGMWSGNFMNWATMQTIDPFRWALTGGYRSTDQTAYPQTVLEKAWGAVEGEVYGSTLNASNGQYPYASAEFPYRGTDQNSANGNLASSLVPKVTPFSNWANFNSAIFGNGNAMVFSGTYNGAAATGYYTAYTGTTVNGTPTITGTATSNAAVYDLQNNLSGANIASQPATFRVYIRVSVCDTSILGTAGLEANCTKYNGGVYKPEGLMQKYSNQMRYSALGYLNGSGYYQQGGVLREPMGYIGPTYPAPLSTTTVTNTLAEWSPTTGIQFTNPDPANATASGVSQSGVIEYLNGFGEYTAKTANGGNTNLNTDTYMSGDNVSELYYAAVRYFENLGDVPEWSTPTSEPAPVTTAVELDGFPAVATWPDPIAYYCQRNFILGIGDDHTHFDYNVGGNGGVTPPYALPIGRPLPLTVSADTFNQAAAWTTELQNLEGISPTPWWTYVSGNAQVDATYFIAGLAYGTHVLDIRPDLTGTQTLSTYWMDVEEYGYPDNLNPYYLATKYGGFSVPSNYTLSNTTPLPSSEYDTSAPPNNTIQMGPAPGVTEPAPDNYFLAGNSSAMVQSLTSAFTYITSAANKPYYASAFSFSGNSVGASTGTESFASQYSFTNWTSTITGSQLTFDSVTGAPTTTPLWTTDTTLMAQLANSGWQNARYVATWSGTAGVPFEFANLSSTQKAALLPSYSSGPTPATAETNYVGYLRGDQTNEVGSMVSGSTKSLRARSLLLGDIVDASLTAVSTPMQIFSDANNPGYAAFKSLWANRPTMVYAGANDGMLHGFVGASGTEQFAYVPSALFQGPTGTPQVNGLAALGNPNFTHHYYVDATPVAYDIDLNNTGGRPTYRSPYCVAGSSTCWQTVLIGGLGKGGTSFYAINVTDPADMNTESLVAGNVMWEFTDSTMGYSFGTPVVVKTTQYGWVVAFTSGYSVSTTTTANNTAPGYLYLVNPATGALLQKIATPSASDGLTQASAYVKDYSDYTADSIYVGDLNGQLWRFNLTAASGTYPAPTLIATLQDASGNAQPVSTAPLIEISPTTRMRYVMVGTGQLLSTSDMSTVNPQTFYAIIDGTAGLFNPDTTPITRSLLTAVTDVTQGVTLSATSKGWYYDLNTLGTGTSGIAWRVDEDPIAYDGVVSFSALQPTITDPCSPSGISEVYAVNYATAKSVIQASLTSSTIVPDYSISSAVTSEKFFMNNGNPELVVGCLSGCVTPIPANLNATIATRLLNWREVPSAE